MGADKNSSRRRWRLQQDEHGFQHTYPTYYPSWPSHAATGVLLDLGTNSQPHRPENTAEHQTRASLTYTSQAGEHHRSNQSLLVKPGDFDRIALHRLGRCNTPIRPVQDRKPQNTKQAYRALKRPKLETVATRDNSELTQTFTRAEPNRGLHRSDR
jgi:hypothetical protein